MKLNSFVLTRWHKSQGKLTGTAQGEHRESTGTAQGEHRDVQANKWNYYQQTSTHETQQNIIKKSNTDTTEEGQLRCLRWTQEAVNWPTLRLGTRRATVSKTAGKRFVFCWLSISILLCNENQLDALFISWLSVGRPSNRQSAEKHNTYQLLYIQSVPGGMCQTSGGCSLC